MDYHRMLHEQLERYEGMTLGDYLPDGESRQIYDDPYKVVYAKRSGNAVEFVSFHKGLKQLFEANAEAAKDFNRTGRLGDRVQMASFSPSVWADLEAKGLVDDDQAIRKILNDPNYAGYRVNNLRA